MLNINISKSNYRTIMLLKHLTNHSSHVCFCTQVSNEGKKYSKTVLLPQTKFPLNLTGNKLIQRDTALSNSPQFSNLYDWQRTHLKTPEFILHDGPPYANGVPHMGHAINKILKDIILRYKILQGQKVHYVPGWDCHGLPIELKAVKTGTNNSLTKLQIREKARKFAEDAAETQKRVFMSWGVLGNWKNAYTTYSPSYIRNQMTQFYKLYASNLIYRDVKPVYWSPSTQTALAEAELEYNSNHKSTAVIVKVKMKTVPAFLGEFQNICLYALIWTTTPWTLPANQAICFNPNLSYSIVQNSFSGEHYIVATNLIESISKSIQNELRILKSFQGDALKTATYFHPIYKYEASFLAASHTSETKGTGLVHTAPAHGPDDFLVALQNKLQVICLVDERGCYTSEAGSELAGLFVLRDGTKAILNMIQSDVLQKETYVHSYPYDWRTKQPVILRASKQWFINTDSIKERALELLTNIDIIPQSNSQIYRHLFATQLQKRPYWCISRQRAWGVPIPVFYNARTDEIIINEEIIDHLCSLLNKHGTDYWWTLPTEELLPETLLQSFNLKIENITKSEDILDIWFDSGLSWSNVLPNEQVADIYVEGVDQFTGWFQSSLLTSVALRDKSPYKKIYVHGFALDEKGMKMSKSLGNVIDPQHILQGNKKMKPYGIDTLRWWVACHANQDSTINISENVLQASSDDVQKVRSVLRFSLGALCDYDYEEVSYDELKLIDKYMLHLLGNFQKQVSKDMENCHFNKVCTFTINFITNSVSALYYNAIKDRLYCDPSDSVNRRSAQFVLFQIFSVLTKTVAPCVPHLAEELYLHLPQKTHESFFQTDTLVVPRDWTSEKLDQTMTEILNIKRNINKDVGSRTVDKQVNLFISRRMYEELKIFQKDIDSLCAELSAIYQVAEVTISEDNTLGEDTEYKIQIESSDLKVCNRCRRHATKDENSLCCRCNLVIDANNKVASVL